MRVDTVCVSFTCCFNVMRDCINIITGSVAVSLFLTTGELSSEFRSSLFTLARSWLSFALQFSAPGRGIPRWARPGLDFVLLVTRPGITWHLEAPVFEQLQTEIEKLVSHFNEDSLLSPRSGAEALPLSSYVREFTGHAFSSTQSAPFPGEELSFGRQEC
jgi:hypothetical protein